MPELLFKIIIFILLFEFALGKLLTILNIRYRKMPLPDSVSDLYDEEKYLKSQQYQSANEKFGLIGSVFSFILMMAFLLSGGFGWLDGIVHGLTNNAILMAFLFFGILAVAGELISLPFTLYHTFIIEEKFGFNKTSWATFILDKIKSYILGALIGGGLLALMIWYQGIAGKWFWLIAWISVTLFSVFISMFYTAVILPLFNKLSPLETGSLRERIENYCSRVGFQLKNIFIMDGSKRSSKANAFFSGIGPRKSIILFDTLVEQHPEEELEAILAHEVGHYKKKHILKGMAVSIIQTGIVFFLLGWALNKPEFSLALGAKEASFHMGILAFFLLYSPLSMLSGLAMNHLSRKNEYEADAFARETSNGEVLAKSLKRLSTEHLSNLNPHPAYVFFHYSHPPLHQRLRALSGSV